MWSKFTNHSATKHSGIALAVLVSAALSCPANAADIWKVNLTKSHLSSGSNTLVLERDSGKGATQGIDSNGNTPFLVVSNGNIYLATNDTTYDASSGAAVRKVDYARWRDMKMVQIGENVRSTDHCGFRCQSGLPDPRMTLTFTAKGGDPTTQMGNIVVLNTQ